MLMSTARTEVARQFTWAEKHCARQCWKTITNNAFFSLIRGVSFSQAALLPLQKLPGAFWPVLFAGSPSCAFPSPPSPSPQLLWLTLSALLVFTVLTVLVFKPSDVSCFISHTLEQLNFPMDAMQQSIKRKTLSGLYSA